MERATKTFKTKNDFEIVANTYITGKEMRDVRDCYIGNADVDFNKTGKGQIPLNGVKGDTISKSEDVAIESLIVSVNGETENIVEIVGNLPSEDYDEVVKYINSITSPKKAESDTSTPSSDTEQKTN
jgi:hypothetical protein